MFGIKTNRFNHIDSVLCILLLVAVQAANADEPRVSMSVELSSADLLMGEPLSVFLKLKWENPETGRVLVTSRPFLSLTVLDPYQEEVEKHPIKMTVYGEPQSEWLKGTILLTSNEPEYENTLELLYLSGFRQPGKYTLSVSWDTPGIDVDEAQDVTDELQKGELSGEAFFLLKEFEPAWEGSFRYSCPSREEDVKAYVLLTGGSCPDEYLSPGGLKEETDALLTVLENHPTSRYAGYKLREWKDLVFAGSRYDRPGGIGIFKALGSGVFLKDLPEVTVSQHWRSNETRPDRVKVDTRSYIQEHRSRLKRFLEENPGFQERDAYESLLGYDALALGKIAEARKHWQWVLDNSKRTSRLKTAQRNLSILEESGLLAE